MAHVNPPDENPLDENPPDENPPDRSRREATPTSSELGPGSVDARAHGCVCSVLANAPSVTDRGAGPFVDPRCPVHVVVAP